MIRVLYAEDNSQDADLTKSCFEQSAPDISLDVVSTAIESVERLQKEHFDAVLMDHRLPDMDGAEVLKELARRALNVPVVIVTGAGDEDLVVRLLRLGAVDYVAKQGSYLDALPDIVRATVRQHERLVEQGLTVWPQVRRALYVEHNAADIDLTVTHFAEAAPHWSLETVRSCTEALNVLGRRSFDLVLIDLRMPDMTALEFLRELKRREQDVPSIVLTGKGDEAAAVASLKLGAYDYIVKRDDYLARLPYASDHAADRFQLERTNHRLQRELVERQRLETALGEHAAALAESARHKDDFLAMLGHELRNPLAPIRTALDLMQRPGVDDATIHRAHDVMGRQIDHMVRLVNDILDVARISTGRITLAVEPLDLRAVIADAVDSVGPLIDSRHQQLTVTLPDAELPVRGDMTRLVQLAVNLLNNAAKYTPEGGAIRISANHEPPFAAIRVSDTGVGVSPRLLPRIFDLFTQDERTLDRAQGGIGLGLSLVRRITELHGGRVKAHSGGRGHGSEFEVRLPLYVAEVVQNPPASHSTSPRPLHTLRCLVVEDNVDAARMLECALAMEGHEVRLAFDGERAIELAEAFRPDAVVLDIGLPRITGYQVARAIRKVPRLAHVNIIAATGYGQVEDQQKALEAGFDHYLVKPIELDALLEILAGSNSAS